MELDAPARQISQAVLLQQESQLIRQAFNQQFEVAQAAKRDLIASVDERLDRITVIERELCLHNKAAANSAALVSWICESVKTWQFLVPALVDIFMGGVHGSCLSLLRPWQSHQVCTAVLLFNTRLVL